MRPGTTALPRDSSYPSVRLDVLAFFIMFCVVAVVFVGFTHAASVIALEAPAPLIFKEALFGAVAYWVVPSSCSAFPSNPGQEPGWQQLSHHY